jgi:hypothetical protein
MKVADTHNAEQLNKAMQKQRDEIDAEFETSMQT